MELSTDGVAALLADAYGVRAIRAVRRAPIDQWNTTLIVETASSPLYLKRYRARYQRRCLAYSHALIHHLRASGCAWPPRYLPTKDGATFLEHDGALYDLSEAVAGETYPMYRLDRAALAGLAWRLADFHRAGRQFAVPPDPAWTHAFHLDDCTPELLARPALQWALLGPHEPWVRTILTRAMTVLQGHGARFAVAELRRERGAPAHGDFTLNNVLFGGGQVIGVMDWESACPGELPLYDVARSAASFCPRGVLDERIVAAFIDAYREEADLPIEHPALTEALWFFGKVKWVVKMLALMTEADLPRLLRSVELVAAELEKPLHRLGGGP
jgi:Ser/Thr protein kinase RdoA (MazF antagonist)